MIGQLSDEVESVAIDLSNVASLGETTLSMVFDARKRAEQSRRARKELADTQQLPDSGSRPSEWQDTAAANDESGFELRPGRQITHAPVRHVLRARSDSAKLSEAGWTQGIGATGGPGARQSPLVRSLLRAPRLGPQSAPPGASGHVHQGDKLEPATLVSHTNPIYPAAAKQSLIAGSVEVHFRISAEGKVYDVKSVRGSPILAQAAMEAVETWCYEPARLNGMPVDSQASTNFDFKLS